VGWEDVYYPVDIYLDHLEKNGGIHLPLFVMSDDYQAVQELKAALTKRGRNNSVMSLCAPENSGFDVWALRAKKVAYRHGTENELVDQREFIDKTYMSAVDLVTETLIAVRSATFIGTYKSNVTKSIWFLHEDPQRCFLLQPGILNQT